ncbi:TPA: transglutaminase-like protease [Methanocaldococcus jannaschii]|nr:transglutaminase-like domain-containing protein [Methanocaldococcus jannaschii]HII59109.1 transglutaminase-like protease [Methanocaldococcus jannaschii]
MNFVYIFLLLFIGVTILFIKLSHFLSIPSLKEIYSNEIKKLSEQLWENSIVETLNNILEWQETNIRYWMERAADSLIYYVIAAMLYGVVLLFMVLLLIIGFEIIINDIMVLILWVISAVVALLVLISLPSKYSQYLNNISMLLLVSIFTLYIFSENLIIISIISGLWVLILTLIVKYLFQCNGNFVSAIAMLHDTLCYDIKVSKILKYKKAVCRDYAKLTIALLSNLFPNYNLYLVTHPMHVAAAIEINGKIYVIDQRLPIREINTWIKIQSTNHRILGRGYKIYKIIRKKNGFDSQKENIEKYIDKNLLNEEYIKPNWDNIIKEIYEVMKSKKPNFEFELKNYAIWYDINDAIIKESLCRYIKNILRKEFCGNCSKIKDIELKQKGKDIVVHLQFKLG